MPVTKAQFSKCGHRGHGAHCHRCEQADKLEKEGGAPFEVERLRGPQRKKGRAGKLQTGEVIRSRTASRIPARTTHK